MIQFKKAALAVLALGVAGAASAAMYVPPPAAESEATVAKHGFYVGIGLGGMAFSNDISGSFSGAIDGLVEGSGNASADGGDIALNSVLFAGYGWTFPNKVFLAGEIFGNLTNADSGVSANGTAASDLIDSEGTVSGSAQVTLQNAYGIRALPGYQVSPSSVVYGVIGWSHANAKGTVNGSAAGSDAIDADSVSGSDSQNYSLNGLQVGLGSMINVTKNIAVRGDLLYTDYENITLVSGSESSDIGAVQGSVTSSPSTLEADVSLVYMFD